MHKSPSSQADSLRRRPSNNLDIDITAQNAARIGASSAFDNQSRNPPSVPPKGDGALLTRSLSTAASTAGPSYRRTTFELPTVTLQQASPVPEQAGLRMEQNHKGTDDTPIAPTTSLVKLFEQNGHSHASKRPNTASKAKPPVTPANKPPATKPKPSISPRLEAMRQRQEYDEAVAAEEAARELRGRPPLQAKPSFKRSSSATAAPSSAEPSVLKTKPNLPPPRRSATKPLPPSAKEPTKSTVAQSPPFPRSSPLQIRKTSSNLSLPEAFDRSSLNPNQQHYQQRSIRQISPHMTGDSLANAIVGAHLASRQTSPHRSGTPTSLPALPARNPRNHQHTHNPLQHWRTRSNSPSKSTESGAAQRISLRTTMRKEASSSSDEGRGKHGKGRKHRFRKHPNKHHEGDRKRWRDTITERERKRYEGLWAANKGLHISVETPKLALASSSSLNTVPTEDVLDLVVRDIWGRSRLPSHVLEEIWDLVDHRGERRLTREEFVVGTWLVDQCLKGRKVPSRVMDSVWASVKLMGVKVRKKNFQ